MASSAALFYESPTPPAFISLLWASFFSLRLFKTSSSGPSGAGSGVPAGGGAVGSYPGVAVLFAPAAGVAFIYFLAGVASPSVEFVELDLLDLLDSLVLFFSTSTVLIFSFWGAAYGASPLF